MVDAGGFSLTTVAVETLREGVKFLYGQAAELLREHRRRSSQQPDQAPMLVHDAEVLALPLSVSSIDRAALEQRASRIAELRRRLSDYIDGIQPVLISDRELLQLVDDLRTLLESIYGQQIVFRGEQGPQRAAALVQPTNHTAIVKAVGIGAVAVGGNSSGAITTNVSFPTDTGG